MVRYKALGRRLDRLKINVPVPGEDKIMEIVFVSATDLKVVDTIYITLPGSTVMRSRSSSSFSTRRLAVGGSVMTLYRRSHNRSRPLRLRFGGCRTIDPLKT